MKGDKTAYRNNRGASLVPYVGKVLLRVFSKILSDYFEVKGLLPEEQFGLRWDRSITDVMFVVHRRQEYR